MKRFLHTALLAVVILVLGVSVLYGVRAFLPDYTQEIHVYSTPEGQLLPVFEQQQELVLYPWKELTQSDPISEAEGLDVLFYELCDAFGAAVSYLDFGKAEICYSADGMTGGVRNVYGHTAQYEEIPTDAETGQIVVSETVLLSAAFDDGVFCYFLAETETETALEAEIQNGYNALCAYAKAPYETKSPFAGFAKRYADACGRLGCRDGILTVETLLVSGELACYLYDGRAYIRYTADIGSLTLICDPVSEAVVGFSLETA